MRARRRRPSVAAADARQGTNGPDRIVGTAGADRLVGKGGRDVLIGRGGRDVLIGDSGGDRLYGGRGRDTLLGGSGNDRLVGGPGRDVISCGAGRAIAAQARARVTHGRWAPAMREGGLRGSPDLLCKLRSSTRIESDDCVNVSRVKKTVDDWINQTAQTVEVNVPEVPKLGNALAGRPKRVAGRAHRETRGGAW